MQDKNKILYLGTYSLYYNYICVGLYKPQNFTSGLLEYRLLKNIYNVMY